jgi:hypothetical protein
MVLKSAFHSELQWENANKPQLTVWYINSGGEGKGKHVTMWRDLPLPFSGLNMGSVRFLQNVCNFFCNFCGDNSKDSTMKKLLWKPKSFKIQTKVKPLSQPKRKQAKIYCIIQWGNIGKQCINTQKSPNWEKKIKFVKQERCEVLTVVLLSILVF